MRHAVQVGGDDAAVDVLAHRHGQPRFRSHELLRLDVLPQPDDLALTVRHLNANRRLAGHALDKNALGFQSQTQIVVEIGNAAALDSPIVLELKRDDYGTGVDLRYPAVDIE